MLSDACGLLLAAARNSSPGTEAVVERIVAEAVLVVKNLRLVIRIGRHLGEQRHGLC